MLQKLDNVQRVLCTCSQSVVADPVLPDVDDKRDSVLPFDELSLVLEDPVASDLDIVDECVHSLCDDQTYTQVILPEFTSDLNDEKLEEVSGIYARKVLSEIPDREIDMKVVDSVKNDMVKHETQVSDKMFNTISIVKCDSSNLFKFDALFPALPCMLLACCHNRGTYSYVSELDHAKLSLHRLPPDQFGLDYLFDPGCSLLIIFHGAVRHYSVIVMDNFKEIIRIVACHIDFTFNDRCILNQFPFDPGAILYIVTASRRLQVHQLQLGTSMHTLVLVKEIFQIWDPGTCSEFMATGSSVAGLFMFPRWSGCSLQRVASTFGVVGNFFVVAIKCHLHISIPTKIFDEPKKYRRMNEAVRASSWLRNALALHICDWFDIGQVLWSFFDGIELGMSSFLHVLIVETKGLQVLDVADISYVCILSRLDALVTFTAEIVNYGISKMMDHVMNLFKELFAISANEEENFCSKASHKSCDVYGSEIFYYANNDKTRAVHYVSCKYNSGQPLLILEVGKSTTIMYTFIFKLDHHSSYLFLVWTDWYDIKGLVDEFHVPPNGSFYFIEFMLLWRLTTGMFAFVHHNGQGFEWCIRSHILSGP